MNKKLIGAAITAVLAVTGTVIGVVVPGGGSDDGPAIIVHEIPTSYSVTAELPIEVRTASYENCTKWGNCDAHLLTELPIHLADPMVPGSSLWLPIYVRNSGAVPISGVTGGIYWINSDGAAFDGLGDVAEVTDGLYGEEISPVNLNPGSEAAWWLHWEVPLAPASGTRNFIIIFQHDID